MYQRDGNGNVVKTETIGHSTVQSLFAETYSTETDTEAIIYDFDLTQGQYVERERISKLDDPSTPDVDESTTWLQRVADRLLFWRG